jgi:probable DNA repair protein
MYAWLDEALDESGVVVTASRRLARSLTDEFARRRLAEGQLAWRTPAIHAWRDWMARLFVSVGDQSSGPTRLSGHQEGMLWERCLRKEIDDPLWGTGAVVRQSRLAWARLAEFGVSIEEVRDAAVGLDQRLFVRVAEHFQAMLARQHWIDEAGIPKLVMQHVAAGEVCLPPSLTFAGFDRIVPEVRSFIACAAKQGTSAEIVPVGDVAPKRVIYEFENPDAELRAAGAWARDALLKDPQQRVAIVVANLGQAADHNARLVKEGLIPGWQAGGNRHDRALNVSHGRELASFPACAIALLISKWLHTELTSRELSILLRSACIGSSAMAGRARLEIRLRNRPDQDWSPGMFLKAFSRDGDDEAEAGDWFERVRRFDTLKSRLPARARPSTWIELMDQALRLFNWPGEETLSSNDFQLLNRWRELLNDFSRLDLIAPALSVSSAVFRLVSMAKETIHQPDQSGAKVELLDHLEAAGMEFDRIWIAGATSSAWPAPRRPLALVNRHLQQKYQMPDADPAEALAFSQNLLRNLASSAPDWVCSYATTENDTEQAASGMLADYDLRAKKTPNDPGWYAKQFAGIEHTAVLTSDAVPKVGAGEKVSSGAMSIQWQLDEPFRAFANARLGIRQLPAFTRGLSPRLRGNLIHDALNHLYSELTDGTDLTDWDDHALGDRVSSATKRTFGRHFRATSPVLRALLALEQDRTARLLHEVASFDKQSRDPFKVNSVEESLVASIEGLELRLRVDRIDRLATGELVILDYKTGAWRRLLDRDGNPREYQLIVYACALQRPIADIGFFNVDSRAVGVDGAGKNLTPSLDWDSALELWRARVAEAATLLMQGDVRLSSLHNQKAARPLSLLSRIAELRDDD